MAADPIAALPLPPPPPPPPPETDRLILELDGFEGPIDLLLTLARQQKVDLARISILALVEQYLAFIRRAQRLRLEVAADYLVMAAWLAYLKSRLLLPEPEAADDDGPSGEEMAETLARRLRRLDAVRRAGSELQARAVGGRERLPRGWRDEGVTVRTTSTFRLRLHELLRAYVAFDGRRRDRRLTLRPPPVFRVEDALELIAARLGGPEWRELRSFLPPDLLNDLLRRSAVAAHFAALLELARSGRVELRQAQPFGPILVRRVVGTAAR